MINDLDVGGAERHLAQVLPRLSEQGFKMTVYTFTHKGKLAPFFEQAGVMVIEPCMASTLQKLPLAAANFCLLLSSVLSLCFQLLRLRPSIAHFFLPKSYLLGGLSSLVLGQRIRIMSRRSLNRYQLKHPLLAKIERWLHSHMDAVLGNSRAVVRELKEEGVAADRLGLLYNGIDLAQFDDLPARGSIRKSLGIGDGALLIVCVANLIPYKGHADLIRALGGIRAELPGDWVVAIVGRDAGIGNKLRALAGSQGVGEHILWLGERNDSIAIFSAADIGVSCSHEEGFSNSVLEGMAANAAMVVTDVGGNAEAVLDGECGIVVPARNSDALGNALLTLAKDESMRSRMAAAGYHRVRENFSVEACVSRYSSLYQALLRDPACRVQDAIDSLQGQVKD